MAAEPSRGRFSVLADEYDRSPPEPDVVSAPAARTRTDLGNAEHFVTYAGGYLRYVHERKRWILWTGQQWRDDITGEAARAAKSAARLQLDIASQIEDEEQRDKAVKWALQSHGAARIRATLELACTERALAISQDQLDRDPFLLACGNGTLDLRTGKLREADPADLITRATSVRFDPDAECPRFERFLAEVLGSDAEMISWLQRFAGYCLTGDTREHVLAVFHGNGANGKSTLLTVLHALLGELSATAAFDTFAPRGRGDHGPRNDLAGLHGARLVTASESGEGRRLDEATVKEITGGDRIAARFLYGEFFEFTPTFKIVLVTNHKPTVSGTDDGIWRRIRLVPFEQSFLGREDRTLDGDLRAELPGVLAWAVRGCLAWRDSGLGDAAAVTQATQAYRETEDTLGAFIAEYCLLSPKLNVKVAVLRTEYEAWCKQTGETPMSAKALTAALERRPDGIRSAKGAKGVRHYHGISLASAPQLEAVA